MTCTLPFSLCPSGLSTHLSTHLFTLMQNLHLCFKIKHLSQNGLLLFVMRLQIYLAIKGSANKAMSKGCLG